MTACVRFDERAFELRPHRIGLIGIGAHRHCEVAGVVHRLADHFGVAMQPAYACTIGRIELKFEQHTAGAEPEPR